MPIIKYNSFFFLLLNIFLLCASEFYNRKRYCDASGMENVSSDDIAVCSEVKRERKYIDKRKLELRSKWLNFFSFSLIAIFFFAPLLLWVSNFSRSVHIYFKDILLEMYDCIKYVLCIAARERYDWQDFSGYSRDEVERDSWGIFFEDKSITARV